LIVISDTSPLNYLVLIKAIDILPVLFEEVHVPTQVLVELAHSKAPQTVRQWASAPPEWVRVSTPTRKIVLPVQLDAGELEAIALALELGADAILIDDRKGRRAAEALGINAVGTVPVLEFAADGGSWNSNRRLRRCAQRHFMSRTTTSRRRSNEMRRENCATNQANTAMRRIARCGPFSLVYGNRIITACRRRV
jgi:predicted nucleic acid-binding protein